MGKKGMNKKTTRIRYYHGGFPGLTPGTVLKPPNETGLSLRSGYARFDPTKVFVTTRVDLARAYALLFARIAPAAGYSGPALGSLYEIKVSSLKHHVPDEDYAEFADKNGPISLALPITAQKIIRVIETVGPNPSEEYKLFAPYQTWESPDGKIYPMWDENGYLRPWPAVERELTSEMLEKQHGFGPYPGLHTLINAGVYIPS